MNTRQGAVGEVQGPVGEADTRPHMSAPAPRARTCLLAITKKRGLLISSLDKRTIE